MTAGELAAAVGANEALAAERSRSVADPTSNTLYMVTMFSLDAGAATALLFERLEGLSDPAQAALVQRVLPRVFGGEFGNDEDAVEHVPIQPNAQVIRPLTQGSSVAPASARQSDVAWSVFLALYC